MVDGIKHKNCLLKKDQNHFIIFIQYFDVMSYNRKEMSIIRYFDFTCTSFLFRNMGNTQRTRD